jgi:hypothetical protein
MFQQAFRQNAGKRGNIELHEIRQIGIEHALQRLTERRMVPPDGENAKTTEEIEIFVAGAVVEVLTLALLEANVIADGFVDADELLIEVARMQGTALRLPLNKQLGNV